MSAGLRFLRNMAERVRRLAIRWLGGEPAADSLPDGIPRHWADYVRTRAPHLLRSGSMLGGSANAVDREPERQASPFPPAAGHDLRQPGTSELNFSPLASRRAAPPAFGAIPDGPPRVPAEEGATTFLRPPRSAPAPWRLFDFPRRSPSPPAYEDAVRRPAATAEYPPHDHRPRTGPSIYPPIASPTLGRLAESISSRTVRTLPEWIAVEVARPAGEPADSAVPEGARASLAPPLEEAAAHRPAEVEYAWITPPRPVAPAAPAVEFNAWPDLPEALPDQFDWREARLARDDEDRMRREQGRL